MQTSSLSAALTARGARVSGSQAETKILTFGDVPAEYEAGRGGALLLDATRRGLIAVRGVDAPSFLHRLLANHVLPLAAGTGNQNLLLSPKGKVEGMFDCFREEQGFVLDAPPDSAPGLLEALDRYLFADAVELVDQSGQWAPLELVGMKATEVLRRLLPSFDEGASTVQVLPGPGGGAVRVARALVAGASGWRLDQGPEDALGLWQALCAAGARPGGLVAEDSLRVEAGVGRWGQDISPDVYPQEARLEDAFALDKGCYVGQEVVAKIDTYGGLNKALFRLIVSDGEPVARGTRLIRQVDGETQEVGLVTSWAWSFRHDTGMVLCYVRKRHQEPGSEFALEGLASRATLLAPPPRVAPLS